MERSERAVTGGALVARGLTKRYHQTTVLDDVDLEVRPGEFVTLLGPSGSGKTTTLGVIAGLVRPDGGTVALDGREITSLPPYRRGMGVVFQSYALFPHRTVRENVGFPLRMQRRSKAEIREHVDDALVRVQLEEFADRYPAQLSGGQQQRAALARAFVSRPPLLLMDEPLGALDKALRESLQLEITRLSRELGLSVVYVTHDQDEALAMSDRIAVYRGGRIAQLGTGSELYERPRSLFVARFLGNSTVLRGRLRERGDGYAVEGGAFGFAVAAGGKIGDDREGDVVAFVIRPEHMAVERVAGAAPLPDGVNELRGAVSDVLYFGRELRVVVEVPGTVVQVSRPGDMPDALERGDEVRVTWPSSAGVIVTDAP